MSQRSVATHYVSWLIPFLKEHADDLVFRPYNEQDGTWGSVTYRELEQQLSVTQAHWRNILSQIGLKPPDVVGFWLTGRKLSDLVNSLAVSALGYTPQFFGGFFSNVSVILDLLDKSGGKALIVDPSYASQVPESQAVPVAHFVALEEGDMLQLIQQHTANGTMASTTFEVTTPVSREDIAVLFHSSGTTGGLPKIIPNTFKMLRSTVIDKFSLMKEYVDRGHRVLNTIGNLAHIGSFHCFVAAVSMGACVAQSSMAVAPRELVGLTRKCNVSILIVYATFLSDLIRAARTDPEIKRALESMAFISHTGVALNRDDDEWAHAHGLKLVTSYGTTETGPMLRSRIGFDEAARALYPTDGANPVFLPQNGRGKDSAGPELHELVVPANADDAPPPQFIADDGYYHTNDLFEKFGDGWRYRGRAGDWIKLSIGFCDTKNIEDVVRTSCGDLIHDAVVVGSGRVSPCLIVEVATGGFDDAQPKVIADTIVNRMATFSQTLFAHERIQDPRRIFVVEKGVLPRTKEKGNVRRPATEEMFEKALDDVSPRA